MRLKFKIRNIALAAANGAVFITAAVMTAVGGAMAKKQTYNYSAEKWGGEDKNYSQMSCFFSDDAGFSVDSVNGIRSSIQSRLQTVSVVPEEGKNLVPDAYSAPLGSFQITSSVNGRIEGEVTAVGGDFFMFRDFKLLDGTYFTKDDLMQDGAVIDRDLAWALYGSDNISGMDMYINGVKFYIAGVIDLPDTKPEKQCVGKKPKAYISYDMAAVTNGTAADNPEQPGGGKFTKITCYECIIPDPVENFAKNAMKEIVGQQYEGKVSIVRNTERFAPKKRAKAYKKLSNSVVRKDSIAYPYWENASRIVEYKLTRLYHWRKLMFIIPVLTLIWIILRLIGLWRRKRQKIKYGLSMKADRLRVKIRGLFHRSKL